MPILLDKDDPVAAAGEQGRDRGTRRPAADDQDVAAIDWGKASCVRHGATLEKKPEFPSAMRMIGHYQRNEAKSTCRAPGGELKRGARTLRKPVERAGQAEAESGRGEGIPVHAARQRFTRELFNETAPVYDRVNRLFSLGSGAWYRRRCLRRAGLRPGMRVLDVAVGTGLVAREAVMLMRSSSEIIGIDVSEAMLAEARGKLGILLIQGAAEELPVADASIDFLTLGYALRHIPDLTRALREFRRVLRPGGILLILELRRPRYAVTRSVVARHFSKFVPLFCRSVTGASETRRLMAYHWETIEQSLPPATVTESLARGGFVFVRSESYFDLFCSYSARNPG
jgi:demethylmenaquinone methyltransferase / 2-methoxy-6-polyprenyl-1,4-benzoquinol methylase